MEAGATPFQLADFQSGRGSAHRFGRLLRSLRAVCCGDTIARVGQPLPSHGDNGINLPQTSEEILPLVYEELRKLAAGRLAGEKPGQTLQPTALVHEAYLRLGGDRQWNHPGHFFGAAAEAMRRILIEKARRKGRVRHGGHLQRVDIAALDLAWETEPESLLLLDAALARLEQHDEVAARLVSLRFFAGVPNAEAARLLDLSETTAKRTWAYARAFLHREMTSEEAGR
jgi:RNA polymerase sigma factor (TIGR02999 family)